LKTILYKEDITYGNISLEDNTLRGRYNIWEYFTLVS